MQLSALFRLAFASAPNLQFLTLLHNVTRRSVLQKVRDHTSIVLSLLVSTGFQVLFHSPPGVLFTFPSRYYALSVTESYLALGGGPPCFPPDSSCLAVLWYQLSFRSFAYGPFTLSGSAFLPYSSIKLSPYLCPLPRTSENIRFGLLPFRSPLLRKSMFLSLPSGT